MAASTLIEATAHTDHLAPAGLRTRGTVVVVPGRGESRATYARFGARLAADAYRVRIVQPPDPADLEIGPAGPGGRAGLERWAARLGEAVEGATTDGTLVRPLVLVGADSGAAAVAALVGQGQVTAPWWPEAVVLAGLPAYAATGPTAWEDELDGRTACPVHRAVLADDPGVRRGALAEPVPPELLDAAYESAVDLPRLVLVGDADPLADRGRLARAVGASPRARLTVVRGAHHDVLNDLQHRSVAAEVVTFLEALRNELVPVIAVEQSTW